MLKDEAPNILTKAYFIELVNAGYRADVICQSDAFSKASVWYGEWLICAVSPDGSEEKFVTSTTDEDGIQFRVFKTANGILSFMEAAGFTYTTIPFKEGARTVHLISQTAQ